MQECINAKTFNRHVKELGQSLFEVTTKIQAAESAAKEEAKNMLNQLDRSILMIEARLRRSEDKLKSQDLTVGESLGVASRKTADESISESVISILASKASLEEVKQLGDRKTNKEDTLA